MQQMLSGRGRACTISNRTLQATKHPDAAPTGTQRNVCPRDSCSRMAFDGGDAVDARADPGRLDFLTADRRVGVSRQSNLR